MDLSGKCAVVTGGGHGIGRALAEALAAKGAKVVVADLNAERATKVADRIGGTALACDIGQRSGVAELVRHATDAFGPVDVFVSNAGMTDPAPGLEHTPEQLELITRVNLLSHVWAAQEVLPSMVERGGGYLVQTISSAALITGPSGVGYTFTKHGALGFAEWVALNYQHLGITVTCLCPNAVRTGFLGRDEDAEESGAAPSDPSADPARAALGEIVEPELCAEMTLDAMAAGRFLVLPHERVGASFLRKADDYDAWIAGTNRRLRRMRGEDV